MKKILVIVLCLVLAISVGLLVACNNTNTPETPDDGHQHSFGTAWKSDGTNHWHECSCGEKSGLAAHTEQVIPAVSASCTQTGLTEGKKCSVCDRILVEQTTVNKTAHDFTGKWESDKSGHWHVCKNADCNEIDKVVAHTPDSNNKCTVCEYQGELPLGTVTAEQWTAAFEALAGMRNFTMRISYGKTLMFTEVMENVIHSYMESDDEVMDVYMIYGDDTVTMWVCYEGMWVSRTDSADEDDFDNAVADIIDKYLSQIAETFAGMYDEFEYDEENKAYFWEITDDVTYRYEFKFAGSSIYSMESIAGVGLDDAAVSTVNAIGTTDFEIVPLHKHEFATEWSSNNVYHWHDATCHDGEVDAKVPHTWGNDNKCTVCGFTKADTTNGQVDQETFEKALQFNGLTNWTVVLYEDGEIAVLIRRAGNVIQIFSDGKMAYYQITDDGTLWYYFEVEEGVWEKAESSEEEAAMFELFIKYGFASFSQLAELWDELTYADGAYTADGLVMEVDSFLIYFEYENATLSIKFDDGEIITLSIEEMDDEEVLGKFLFGEIGTTTVTLPDATLHEHEWKIEARENYHDVFCKVCGISNDGEHKYGEDGACTVCGAQNHKHVYNAKYVPSDYERDYHHGVCACGVISNNIERHEFGSDDVCELCGAERHIHNVVEWYERNEYYHEGRCSECGSFGGEHEWGADSKTCIVCEYERHIHQLDPSDEEFYYDKNGHRGQCTDPECPDGGYVNWENHIWGENKGNCIVCGAPYHEHNYVWVVGGSVGSYDHELICSDTECSDTRWEGHDWDGDTCTVCGYQAHDHVLVVEGYYDGGHYGRCSICGTDIWDEHDFSNGDTCSVCDYFRHEHQFVLDFTNEWGHYGHCSICERELSDEHDYTEPDEACSVCGVKNHDHQPDGNPYIDPSDSDRHIIQCECGYIIDTDYHHWTDGNGECEECHTPYHEHDFHWVEGVCESSYNWHQVYCECGKYDEWEHTFGENPDECDVCGAARHEHDWQFDENYCEIYAEGHGLYCPVCDARSYEQHVFDDDSDEECNVCGAPRHHHSVDGWVYDDNGYHRGECHECGTVFQEHEVSDWHDNGEGMHEGQCDVCGEQITREHRFEDGDDCLDCEYSQSND